MSVCILTKSDRKRVPVCMYVCLCLLVLMPKPVCVQLMCE
jgi:hypothetical protein